MSSARSHAPVIDATLNPNTMPTRPNILLTIADDQRHDTIGPSSAFRVDTPALDRLSERGTYFTCTRIPGSSHGAVCAPSRAMLHTGRSLFHTSDAMTALNGEVTLARQSDHHSPLRTLGERLGEAGYLTHATGKWHNGKAAFLRSFASNGPVFFGGMSSHFFVPCEHELGHGHDYIAPLHPQPVHSVELFTASAITFLEAYARGPKDRPFFLYVAFTAPHDPHETYWKWHEQYRPEEIDLPPSIMPLHPLPLDDLSERDEHLEERPLNPDAIRFRRAAYAALLAHLDDGIDRIHQAMDALGLSDSTLIAHTSDHGVALGEHGLMGKQSLYEHSIRVPLIVSGPDVPRATIDNSLRTMQDLYPSLLAAASARADDSSDFQRLDDTPHSLHTAMYGDRVRSVCDHTYKLLLTQSKGSLHRQVINLRTNSLELPGDDAATRHGEHLMSCLGPSLDRHDDPLRALFVRS